MPPAPAAKPRVESAHPRPRQGGTGRDPQALRAPGEGHRKVPRGARLQRHRRRDEADAVGALFAHGLHAAAQAGGVVLRESRSAGSGRRQGHDRPQDHRAGKGPPLQHADGAVLFPRGPERDPGADPATPRPGERRGGALRQGLRGLQGRGRLAPRQQEGAPRRRRRRTRLRVLAPARLRGDDDARPGQVEEGLHVAATLLPRRAAGPEA
mmetsp:Transcript_26278/g.85020  ORF Transcript_26278/g.85020 Transcript_26278/m.85020 type:complete len:210 (-) Transcript_26278:571-1200(-)